ncbi:MAG: hypothetical protein ACOC3S_02195 [Bacteroidota bacterium]
MSKKYRGILGTLLFHLGLVILFLIAGFHTPLPLPAEEGILVNFGNSPTGRGNIEPAAAEPVPTEPQPEQEIPEETPMTQDFEDAPAIDTKQESKPKETPKPEESKPKETKPEEPEEEPREVNRRALYPGKNANTGQTGSEGETSGEGNQGNPFGSPDSDNHAEGNSQGTGGISFSLAGRNPVRLPKPEYNYQVEGKVVVEVIVDKQGNVTKATPGVRGSTTLDSYLLNVAEKAALRAKFDRKPDAPLYQKGTITYLFRLQ